MTEPKSYTKVGDVMSISIHSISPMATVQEAIIIMKEKRVSSLMVDRKDPSDEFALVTIADIAGQVIGEDRTPERVNVYEVMSKPVLTLAVDMNIKYAARMLHRFKLTRALVVDNNRLPVGIVTLRDMVTSHAAALRPSSKGDEA